MNQLEEILKVAISQNATDIHVSPNHVPVMRVSNVLSAIPAIRDVDTSILMEQILEKLNPEEREMHKNNFAKLMDIDCGITYANIARVRANIYRTIQGISIALRILPAQRLSADQIGIPEPVRKVCNLKSGIFIVTGASGSGKTTTLAAMMDILNVTRRVHIITIEDPIEYVYESRLSLFSQREVHQHTQTFHSALRSSLRENPDVILLGEMRDPETVSAAVELAATGHLVLATMHTRNAVSSIDRLLGQFPPTEQNQIRIMISETLIGVLAQTLVANKTGGLIAAFEVMFANNGVRNLIREAKVPQIYTIIQTSQKDGMITMEESLMKMINKGLITPKEAISRVQSPLQFIDQLKNSPFVSSSELLDLI